MKRVALIGVDSPIGLTVLRELGERGVPVIPVGKKQSSLGAYSRHATNFVVRPAGSIADWLPDLVRRERIEAVMAVSEGDLVQLAALKSSMPEIIFATPDAAQLNIVLDKMRTFEAARKIGIDVPDSWQPTAQQTRARHAGTLAYPVAVKWSDPPAVVDRLAAAGIALEKVEYADDADDLLAILSPYDAFGEYPLVQTWCPGTGLGQMFNMVGDSATLVFQHRRLREWPPSGGVSTCCASVPCDQHIDQQMKSENLLRSIGWEGTAMVEYRYDEQTGRYWLMEINGRFWGSIPLAHHCGAHFGWEAYRTLVLGEVSPSEVSYSAGRARYMIPDAKHFVSVMFNRSRKFKDKLALFAKFLDLRGGFYVWQWRDPKPLFGDLLGVFRKLLRQDN